MVDSKFSWAIVAPPFRLAPVIPDYPPVIPAKAGIQTLATKQSPEIKYKQQPSDPFSLYGLTGVVLIFGVSADAGT